MLELHERYLTDTAGRRIAVVIDLPEFEWLMAEYERLAAEVEGRTNGESEESEAPDPEAIAEALSIIGIGEDTLPLIDGKPVSEYADLYLYGDFDQMPEIERVS